MEFKLLSLLPTKSTGCLIRIKNVSCFDKDINIKHFLEHIVEVCLIQINHSKNEAYALLHSNEEVLHFMKLYKTTLENMVFLNSHDKHLEIDIIDTNEEMLFWENARKNNLNFFVCCNSHK
ncbi:conserved protein, unknown function [Hepatocystis sp. ex Piliocolobus tephrosceles]|nr:conserved protein, unknown function [Hepatocystis sp. ex Piliocolobus tephrosceles]